MTMIDLFMALLEALRFENIDPKSIKDVGHNVGVTWFESDGIIYAVSIQTVEYELDEPESPNPF